MKKPSAVVAGLFQSFLECEPGMIDTMKAKYSSCYGFVASEGKWGPFASPFLTPVHLALALSVSQKTLERWRLSGEGPAYIKVSKQVRYPVVELDKWVRNNLVGQAE